MEPCPTCSRTISCPWCDGTIKKLEEAESRAKLVPELLEACKAMLRMPLPLTRRRQEQLDRNAYRDVVQAAITKAEPQ